MAVENRIVVTERIKDSVNGITLPFGLNLEPLDEASQAAFGSYEGQTWYQVMDSAQTTEEMIAMGWINQGGLLFGLIANEVLDGKTEDANYKGAPKQDTHGSMYVRAARHAIRSEEQERAERKWKSDQGIFGATA